MAKNSYVVPDNQLGLFDLQTPSMPVFDKSRCEAKLINYETAARMVETYHYAHRVPSIVVAVGMFVDEVLAGVCTYGIPPNRNALLFCGNEYESNCLELNRLFILDWAGRNSESWLIGQSFRLMPDNYFIFISYADTRESHTGYIYQATNWLYTGVSPANQKEFFIDGERHTSKNVYNRFGTEKLDVIERLGYKIETVKKSDKHRYVYFLGSKSQKRKLRKALKWPVLPYPKEKE